MPTRLTGMMVLPTSSGATSQKFTLPGLVANTSLNTA